MARLYSPDIQPVLQSLLGTLADIDFAFKRDLETVEHSSTDEVMKRRVIEKLQQRHREQRESYVQQLADLKSRIEAVVA
jgi:hypothetical protein